MKMVKERTKNATRNMIFGILQRMYHMLVPFFMRTAMIYFMGVQYVGLNSLFTSILQVLNLAELGVGSAMVYSMYKPIAEDDKDTICALMRLYKIYYRVIGSAIAVVGLGVTPFIPCLVSGSIPENLNLHILYLLNLAATVFSYWLFAYKNSLLMAHQRTDVTSKVSIAVGTVQYCTQFLAIYIFKNYYFYLIMAILSQIANNIVTSNIVSRMYPDYLPKGKLSKKVTRSINGRIKDLFIAKLGGVVLNSADTIVISAFLGLTLLAVYQNYYFIISSICGIMETLLTSIRAGLGNSYVTESREKNYIDLKKITFMFYWLIGMCTCCFLGVFQPFMELWVGESFLLPFSVVVLLCVYFYLYCIYPFWKKKYTIENDVYAYRYNLNGITYKSRGNVKSIDHYWIMLYLWDWIKDKQILRSDEWLQISMLDNMVLGYLRTKDLDEKTVQSGFVVLRKRYLSSFANPPRQQNKYILLDKSLRKKDFGQFKLLCDRWRYL